MNIGMIVHSQSGFTLGFAERIAGKLRAGGHAVEVIGLKTDSPTQPRATNVVVKNIPDCGRFDAVLVGGPVLGFAASPVVLTAIRALMGVSGKRVLPFVTQGFPFTSMGGKQAIAQMTGALNSVGAKVMPATIIPKMFHNRVQLMETAATQIVGMF